MFQKLDTIKATFQLSRILSDSPSDGVHQLSRALEYISSCLAADRTYLSHWSEAQKNIRTIAQWQVEQLDPMPTEPIRLENFSALDEYFGQNRGMFSLFKEPIFAENCLIGVLCAESRDPTEVLGEDELQFVKYATFMLSRMVQKTDISTNPEGMDLLETNNSASQPNGEDGLRAAPQVLIVEDNKINQLTIRKMLQRCGVEVDTADDGLLGISACQKKKFDLILMDLSMPNLDGFDTTREIVTSCLFNKTTPIVAVSANTGEDAESRCLKVGMREFVAKPLRIERVKELVQKYLTK